MFVRVFVWWRHQGESEGERVRELEGEENEKGWERAGGREG